MGQTDKHLSLLINFNHTRGETSRPGPPNLMQEDAQSISEVVSPKQLDLKASC